MRSPLAIRLSRPDAFLGESILDTLIVDPTKPDIGTGPFKLVTRTPSIKAERYTAYYRGMPGIDKVEVITYDGQRAAWVAMMRGEVDMVQEVNRDSAEFLEGASHVHMYSTIRPYYIPLVFNLRHPILKRVEVRRALAEAINRDEIVEQAMRGHGRVADDPIWPFHWAYNAAARKYTHNPNAARLRMDAAGLPMRPAPASGGMASRFSIRCLFWNDPQFERIALLLQRQLAEVGIDLVLEGADDREMQRRAGSGDFDTFLYQHASGKSFDYTYRFWHSPDAGGVAYRTPATPASTPSSNACGRFGPTPRSGRRSPICANASTRTFQLPFLRGRKRLARSTRASTSGNGRILMYSRTCGSGARSHARPPRDEAMNSITGRFVLLIATAAVLPLVVYGLVSVSSLRTGTEQSVGAGNQAVAQQIAYRIELYFNNNVRVLASIATQIRGTQLERWQQERILRNHVLDFREFREISVFDGGGHILATSRIAASTLTIPSSATSSGTEKSAFYVETPHIDADGLPTTTIAVSLAGGGEDPGWIVAEMSLEELWRTVDSIKVGTQGYALLMDEQAKLLAHGNPNDKPLIATGASASAQEKKLATDLRLVPPSTEPEQFWNVRGEELLAVAAAVRHPEWTVVVEQPTDEAFAVTQALERQLLATIGLALLGTVVLGWLWGRSFIQRIFALTRVTRAIADGRMDERVALPGTTRSVSSATRSTRWPIGWSNCRTRSGNRNGRRCSAASPRASSTTCRIRSRTSATAAS